MKQYSIKHIKAMISLVNYAYKELKDIQKLEIMRAEAIDQSALNYFDSFINEIKSHLVDKIRQFRKDHGWIIFDVCDYLKTQEKPTKRFLEKEEIVGEFYLNEIMDEQPVVCELGVDGTSYMLPNTKVIVKRDEELKRINALGKTLF